MARKNITKKSTSNQKTNRKTNKTTLSISRFNTRSAIIFALVIGVIGGYFIWRTYAATGIFNWATTASNLTTDSNGPRVVSETDGSKRSRQVVFVKAPSNGTNTVFAFQTVTAGSYDVCSSASQTVSGSAATMEVRDSRNTLLSSKAYVPNGTNYVSNCATVKPMYGDLLKISNIVTAGSFNFSTYSLALNGTTPLPTNQPPADTALDSSGGRFRVSCKFSHRAQVDPIVAPFAVSGHMHDFFGNKATSSDPSYQRQITATSSCGFSKDTAAYWFPSLKAPDGTYVTPQEFLFYYRARPVGYQYGTNFFPPSFKMIAGGVNATDTAAYWTCKGESDTGYESRKTYIPNCTGVQDQQLIAHVLFPSCWDGKNLDSADHRSHVTYGLDKSGNPSSIDPKTCPSSHPYKIPQLDLRVVYPIINGTGYELSDHTSQPHADFWNTWQQASLEKLIVDCLRSGTNCEGISD